MSPVSVLSTIDLREKWLSFFLLLPLSVVLALAVTESNNYVLLLLVAGITFFSILTRFEVGLVLIALCSFFLSYAIWFFEWARPLINLGYLLIIMLLIREFFFTSSFQWVRTPINYLLFSLTALSFLSIAGGDSSFYPSAKGILRHLGFPFLFFLILIANPKEETMRKLVIGIIIVAFVQIPASVFQFFWYTVIAPKPLGMRSDYSGGLLGPNCGGYTAVLLGMVLCILIGFIIVRGFRWYWGAAAAGLILPIYLASARAGIFIFAAAILFTILFAPLARHIALGKRLIISLVAFFLIIGSAAIGLGGGAFQAIFNPDYVYSYSIKQADAGMGRIQAFSVVNAELRTPIEKLVGRGPGMLTPTSIVDNPNSLVAQDPLLYRNLTGYAYTTLELGYLGLLLFLILFIQVYRFCRRFLKYIDDPFWEAVALGFCGTIFVFVISTFYIDSWIYYPLPFTFWALAAAIYRVGIIRGIL
ncbi:MAG: hypothetical protein ABH878_05415 [bacterium]